MGSARGHRGMLALLAVAVSVVCAGCLSSTPPTASQVTASLSPPPATQPGGTNVSPGPSAAGPPSAAPSAPSAVPSPTTQASCAERTLASMTEAQRIGQLFMLGLAADQLGAPELAAIAAYHFGSVWFTAQTAEGAAAVRVVTAAVQRQATRATTADVRFFVAANQEGGLIQALSGSGFSRIPSALDQGSLTPAELEADALRWGRQLGAAGINFDFAPVADVVPPGTDAANAPIGQLQREFGHDPATVRSHVRAFIAGMEQAGIATSAKHFPGLGRVVGNTDFAGAVTDDVTVRQDPYLDPFAGAIDAGVPFVMVSLATYERIDPAHLAVFSPDVIGGMLRGDLGFAGVVISDDLGAAEAVSAIPPAARAIDFLVAGGDMIISKTLGPADAMARAIATRVTTDGAFRARVDAAAMRILQAKAAFGLVPCG